MSREIYLTSKFNSSHFITFIFLFQILILSQVLLVSAEISSLKLGTNSKNKQQVNPSTFLDDTPSESVYHGDDEIGSVYNNSQDEFKDNNQGKINSISNTIHIDPIKLSCNLSYLEKPNFSFNPPTNKIYYTIISQKNPLVDFNAQILGPSNPLDVSIIGVDVYQDKSFNERSFVDESFNNFNFRDRWIIVVSLNKPVSQIAIGFSYTAERAILINDKDKVNLVKIALFNPYMSGIPYDLNIMLTGFQNLSTNQLSLPYGATSSQFNYKRGSQVFDNGMNISMNRFFDSYSQYEFFFSLPFEIKTCDAGFVNFVYYGLIGVTILFAGISLFTILYIYKE